MSKNTEQQTIKGAAALHDHVSALSDRLAQWLDNLSWVPSRLEKPLALITLLGGLLLIAWVLYVLVRPLLLRWMHRIIKRTPFSWDEKLFGFSVFRWATHFVPALFIYLVAPGLLKGSPTLVHVIVMTTYVYMVIAGFFVIDSLLNFIHSFHQESETRRKFITGPLIQGIKLVAALIAVILIMAILIGKSPMILLGGLGMFASVLMLVFKDVILGLVAGIQVASNNMLKPGDWLEMPGNGAAGDVEEIGLTIVKVRNFDKSVTTIPTCSLVSQPFKNWHGMTESGGRRIKRNLLIDVNSIQLADESMLKRFREINLISEYLKQKESEIARWNREHSSSENQSPVNGRRLTNIGTFRAYIEAFLKSHPMLHQEGMTLLVRQLAPGERGLPIEIYCFTTTTAWVEYEKIQADIFDHLLAVAPEFNLRIFQQPSGSDMHAAFSGTVPK